MIKKTILLGILGISFSILSGCGSTTNNQNNGHITSPTTSNTASKADQGNTTSTQNNTIKIDSNTATNSTSTDVTQKGTTSTQNNTQNISQSPPYSLSGKYKLASKIYSIQGTIVSINQTANEFQSITLKITKNIPTADSSVENLNFPFHIGSTQEIKFEEPLTDKGNLDPKAGDEIILKIGQYQVPGNTSLVWGSNFQWYRAVN